MSDHKQKQARKGAPKGHQASSRPRGVRRNQAQKPKPEERKMWEVPCVACDATASVPFAPRPGSDVYCDSCLEQRRARHELNRRYNSRDERRKDRGQSGIAVPRIEHGTRVICPIVCTSCGAQETLSYKPRDMDTVLCSTCLREKKGSSWRDVKREADAHKPIAPVSQRPRRVVEVFEPNRARMGESLRVKPTVRIRQKPATETQDEA